MREIKFRAYSIVEKRMFYNEEKGIVDQDQDDRYMNIQMLPSLNKDCFLQAIHLDNGQIDTEEFEGYIMQYTGLKDKNGKEIYEGDIVKSEGALYDDVIVIEFTTKPMADYDASFYSWGYSTMNYPEEYEVIGNIYENPELLRG